MVEKTRSTIFNEVEGKMQGIKNELSGISSVNIQIQIPTYDLYRDREELVKDLMEAVKYHLVSQIDNLRGE